MFSNIHNQPDVSTIQNISLNTPIQISNKTFFCKLCDYTWNINEPNTLYIQTPECYIDKIIDSSISKKNISLAFSSKENVEFINWIKELHIHIKEVLFNNRKKWFKTELEQIDFENMLPPFLTSVDNDDDDDDIKYTLNTSVQILNKPNILKIYDIDETEKLLTDITPQNTKIITILELRGIKCLQQNHFIPEFFIRQILIIPDTIETNSGVDNSLLSKCCITTSQVPSQPSFEPTTQNNNNLEVLKIIPEEHLDLDISDNSFLSVSELKINDNEDDPIEIQIDLEALDEVKLKQPQEIYYNMYQEARMRAKTARAQAVAANLEVKNIKNLYDLDCISSDEEDEDGLFKLL